MKTSPSLTLAVVSAALACPVQAQSQANSIGDFTMERVLTLSSVSSPATPMLPDQVLAGLQSGAIELHQLFVYTSAQRTLEQTDYIVPGNSPLPYSNLSSAPVGDHYIIQVDSVAVSQAHGPSVAMVGHVVSNDIPTPFGDITGAEVALTFGYQGSGPSTGFGPIVESVSPIYNIYSASGVGSLSPNATAPKCSVATLNGVYMYTLRGYVESSMGVFSPALESGRFTADGNGNVTVQGIVNNGGKIVPDNLSLTAVINDDCTGSLTNKGGGLELVVSSDGQRVNLLFNNPASFLMMGDAQKQ